MSHEHFTARRKVELTCHELTTILMKLDPTDESERAIGAAIAYNDDWRAVFKAHTRVTIVTDNDRFVSKPIGDRTDFHAIAEAIMRQHRVTWEHVRQAFVKTDGDPIVSVFYEGDPNLCSHGCGRKATAADCECCE